MGHIYICAIGLILTYFFHGKDKAKVLCQNCIGCGACKNVCAGDIDLPRLIREIRSRLTDEQGSDIQTALPAIASQSFRDRWPEIVPKVSDPKFRVAIFSGCAQDFVYPEQIEACVKILAAKNVDVDSPFEQSCCGLPLEMMGQRKTAVDVAEQNVRAFFGKNYDAIITLCASCASHLKHNYPTMLDHDARLYAEAKAFADRITDFSSFVHDKLELGPNDFQQFRAKSHLSRLLPSLPRAWRQRDSP